MQPPPQSIPAGAGPPPPLATSQNMYWRSGPLGRRANPAVANAAPGPVRPVTDPFAFGMQAPQASPLGSSAKGDLPATQGLTPAAFPPAATSHPPQLHAGDNNCGPNKSSPALISQSGPSSTFSNMTATMSFPVCPTSRAEVPPGAEYGISHNPSGQSDALGARENSVGGHQGWTSVPESWPSGQDLIRNPTHPSSVPSPLLSFHPPLQHPVPQWLGAQGNPLRPQGHMYSSYPEPPVQNASSTVPQTAVGLSQSGPPLDLRPSPPQHPAVQSTPETPSGVRGTPGQAALGQNTGGTSHWSSHFPQEHFYLQPLEMASTPLHLNAQEHNPSTQLRGRPSQAAGEQQGPTGAEMGTISMFFKRDEAENEEILSLERSDGEGKADFEEFQSQTMGHTYYQPLHSHQVPAAGFPSGQPYVASTTENEADAQHSCRTACAQHGFQAAENPAFAPEGPTGLTEVVGRGAPQYENMENQEVLPNEPPAQSHPSPGTAPDSSRYASLLGPALPKSSWAERGPNLEAPDMLLRPDSVSSNYSNLSHRSLSGSTRSQRLGTFIQQESGKLEKEEEDSSTGGFFKQVDSSPLGGGEASGQNPSKGYHYGSLSQAPPAPSPPKPTGVFHTSANSSFEPVRSHASGLRPAESDQANVVAELREKPHNQRNAKESPAPPVASPGNMEQPPDNLETLLPFQTHPLPLLVESSPGAPLQPSGAIENIPPSGSERRPSARVQVAVKKCESPATTLWAPNELPSFGAGVLLAPAAPALYVPAKASSCPVVQPPEEGWPAEQEPPKQGSVLPPTFQAGNHSSENLENPPQMGDEETLPSQASSGYASLLSSPPTEALHNPPVWIAQANQSACLTQPVNFFLANQRHKNGHNSFAKDPAKNKQASEDSSQGLFFPTGPARSLAHSPSATLPSADPSQLPSENATNQPTHLPGQPASHGPLNLAPGKHQNTTFEGGPPSEWVTKPGTNAGPPINPRATSSAVGLAGRRDPCHLGQPKTDSAGQEFPKPLDYTVAKSPAGQSGSESHPQHHNPSLLSSSQQFAQPSVQVDPEAHRRPFYPQPPEPSGRAIPLQPHPQQNPPVTLASQPVDPQQPSFSPNPQPPARMSPAQVAGHRLYPAGPLDGSSTLPPASHGQGFSDQTPNVAPPAGLPSVPGQPPPASEQQQTPQNAFMTHPYYYYQRHPYEGYPSAYPPPYPPVDPRAAHLYYQEDAYSRYDPSYRQYGSAAAYGDPESYRYLEPERPSSRASHTSDRPPSRQGYPEDYYNTKGGWSNYYAESYANAYDYGAAYDARYRDLRAYDQRYWYDTEQHSYPKREAYPYGNSQDRYEDHWRYDPRFAGNFEDDLEPRRDPYGDEFDRRSIHSEHSGHSLRSSRSLHSRQSSFSSRSQQSQLYQSNHDLTAAIYEGDPQASLPHADYSGGVYPHYINPPSLADYNHSDQGAWSAMEQVPSRPLTPEKFSVPHICARFGPGGSLIKVLPNLPSEGQPALVEIHSMEMILQRSSEQEDMRSFPGPLTKEDTHKVDVINFAQKRALRCFQDETTLDKESARLLWDFVVLLCRQNGTVVGTDIAELLLSDHKTVWLPGKSPNEANLIDFTNEALEQAEEESGEAQLSFLTDSLITTIDSLEKETERFRELLLYGRKKDALESAMKHGLWGHALLLASKMDSRTHARVMTRFANSLPINDPLQTVYQLMSGRMPAASTCCGDEKWGDWRPHLAMVLSNLTSNMEVESRTIVTMGDTLASKGLLDAAHFCYLMAQVGFGVYTKKTSKLVLLGSNHSLPFVKFATNEAIRRTEAYEYAQSLGTHPCSLPNFQVFKFIYACRLAEMGLPAQAFHYCEVISKAILRNPGYVSPVLVSQLIQISSQLRLFDPQIKEKPEQEIFIEPDWLIQLRHLDRQIKEGSLAYSPGRSTPRQYGCSTPSSELDRASQNEGTGRGQDTSSGPDNPLLASLLPGATHSMQGVQLMPSAPPTILEATASSTQPEIPGGVPFYPVGPAALEPGAGFPGPFVSGETPARPGMGVPPAGLPPQTHDLHQEPVERESAALGSTPESQVWKPGLELRDEDFYTKMANMGSGRRSRTTSQSSAHMGYGPRSRTTSESSVHSVGRERPNSASKQPSPPPPPIPEGKETKRETKKEPPARKSGATWFGWLMGKSRNEAHLPDDKNKSIVWDEKKQRWVNLDEPEESKPLPPPPIAFPQVAQVMPRGPANSSVNMFSRKAATSKAQYVDFLKPSRTPSSGVAPAPSDLFATLAPMPIPANLFVPNTDEQQPSVGNGAEDEVAPGSETGPEMAAERPYLNSVAFPSGPPDLPQPHPEGSHSGEPPLEGPPTGAVQFYNPSQFAQSAAGPGSSRTSRIGQRQYPTLK